MLRVVLLHAFLLALPFMVYAGYVYLVRKGDEKGVDWENAPWLNLLVAGLVLIIVAMALLGVFGAREPEGTYVPAYVEDGKVVPGRIVPPDELPPDESRRAK